MQLQVLERSKVSGSSLFAICLPSYQLTQCSFPGHLTEVLLRTAVPVDSSNLSNIISTLDHYKERLNQKLHTDSVRCLAYLLLSSSASSEKERGLHLLLVHSCFLDIKMFLTFIRTDLNTWMVRQRLLPRLQSNRRSPAASLQKLCVLGSLTRAGK